MVRGGLAPRGIWGGVQGVGQVAWVNTRPLVCGSPYGMASGGQIGLGCVMSHHHIDGLCTFQFKFWRENSKWSFCQQLVTQKYFP